MIFPAKLVMARTVSNKFRSWAPSQKHSDSAFERICADGYCSINHEPRFKINKNDSIFTIGSCFARNVENKLARSGFNFVTSDFSLSSEYYLGEGEAASSRGVLNKYNPHSMKTEILRALGHIVDIADNGFIEISDEIWHDPQASRLKPSSFNIMKDIRDQLNEVSARVKSASVVFITLGLTETWYDTVTGMSLNQPPNPMHLRRLGERIFFKNTTCSETIENIEEMIAAIVKAREGNVKFIITVSPVPMGQTFTGKDVIIANTYSKSTLRSAVLSIVDKYDYVDYFPSYEMVVNSPRHLAWKEDGAHVRSEMVSHIMDRFGEIYFQ